MKKIKNWTILTLFFFHGFFSSLFRRNFSIKKNINYKNTFIIVGGGINNKGAQAMTFTVVDHLKTHRPNFNIFVFTRDKVKNEEDYTFSFKSWSSFEKIALLLLQRKLRSNIPWLSRTLIFDKILEDTDSFIDISGLMLTSNIRPLHSTDYLLNIAIAKKYSAKFIILPQSIGPFDYPFPEKLFLNWLIKKYIQYPLVIFAREESGYNYLQPIRRDNVRISPDIVFQNRDYQLKHIFRLPVNFPRPSLLDKAVGIIFNVKVFERVSSKSDLLDQYKKVIDNLITSKRVYLLCHSSEDMAICKAIKTIYHENDSVILVDQDFNAIELEMFIKFFEFIIASRYHSVVHAYKNGVPAIVIGWADKYNELLRMFDQGDYVIDCRHEPILADDILKKVKKLEATLLYERNKISAISSKILANNILKEIV